MANIKITDLDAYTNPDSTDVLPIVDVGADETKKVSIADLMENAGSGTDALPGISFDGDPDTGISRPADDQLAISTGGTQRILIDDSGVVTIAGDLTVNGTTTTVNSTTVTVDDKNIELGSVGTPTDTTADGGGITLKGATDKTLNWVNSTDSWTSSENVDLASGKTYKIAGTDVLSATALGSAVQISSDNIPSGTIVNDDVNASAAIAGTKISPDFGAQDLTVDTNVLHVSATSNHVGIGTTNAGSADLAIVRARDASNYARFSIGQNVDGQGSTGGNHLGLWYGTSNTDRADIFTSAGNMNFWVDGAADGTGQFTFGRTFNAEWMRIDDSGRLLVGTSNAAANGTYAQFGIAQFEGNSSSGSGSAIVVLRRGEDPSNITNNEDLGVLTFSANGGQEFATIRGVADGAAGAGDFPGRLVFSTTADAASSPTERMRISANGNITVDTDTFFVDAVNDRIGVGTTTPDSKIEIRAASDTTEDVFKITNDSDNNHIVIQQAGSSGYAIRSTLDLRFDADYDNNTGDAGSNILFRTEGSEKIRIDPSGRLLVGASAVKTVMGFTQKLQVEGTSSTTGSLAIIRNSDDGGPPSLVFSKSRGSAVGDHDQLTASDDLGTIYFNGANGTNSNNHSAQILVEADETITTTSAAGRMHLRTTPSGSTAAVTRLFIDSNGNIGVGTTGPQTELHLQTSGATGPTIRLNGTAPLAADSLLGGIDFFNNDGSGFGPQVGAFVRANAVGSGGDGGYLAFGTNDAATGSEGADATEKMRLDSSGRLLVGTTTAFGGNAELLQIARNGGGGIALLRNDLTVSSGNELGAISWYGNDSTGTTHEECATIRAFADGDHADGDKPTRLVFSTTADGESSPTVRMAIKENGRVGIGTTGPTARLTVFGQQDNAELEAISLSNYDYASGETGQACSIRGLVRNDGGGQSETGKIVFGKISDYSSAANRDGFIGFHTNNSNSFSERARIDNEGRLLVGMDSAIEATDNTLIQIRSANGGYFIAARDDTSVADGNLIGGMRFYGNDSDGNYDECARINCVADGTHGDTSKPSRLQFFTTADGESSPTERMRIQKNGYVNINKTETQSVSQLFVGNGGSISFTGSDQSFGSGGNRGFADIDGTAARFGVTGGGTSWTRGVTLWVSSSSTGNAIGLYVPSGGITGTTTASAANVHVDTSNVLRRSTSSRKYKANIETIENSYSDALLNVRPVWYRSTADADNPDHGFWGFIAEEVAEIDPRLVNFKTYTETFDDQGNSTKTPLDTPEPEGVQYDRFVPHLLNLIKRQKEQIEALEARLTAAGI